MTLYFFTVPEGDIGCASNPAFGREVYFHPKGYTDESYIGTPLNKAAVDGLKLSHLTPNVYTESGLVSVLNETVQIGMISN